jgi:glutathione S-transferase
MKLYGTPTSHFARKVRILLDLYSVPYEFVDVGNVAEGDMEKFAGNPLMKVPILSDGTSWLIESDHIANDIVQKFDSTDRYLVRARDPWALNIRAVLNGIMSEEVKVILARRTGVPIEQYRFFDDAREAIFNGLQWLEENASRFNIDSPRYQEFHLVCAWEHLEYFDFAISSHTQLKNIVASVNQNKTVQKTSPFLLKPKI